MDGPSLLSTASAPSYDCSRVERWAKSGDETIHGKLVGKVLQHRLGMNEFRGIRMEIFVLVSQISVGIFFRHFRCSVVF